MTQYRLEMQQDRQLQRLAMQEAFYDLKYLLTELQKQPQSRPKNDFINLIISNIGIICRSFNMTKWLYETVDNPVIDELVFGEFPCIGHLLEKYFLFYQGIHHPKYYKVSYAKREIKDLKKYLRGVIDVLICEYEVWIEPNLKINFAEYVKRKYI